MPMSFNFVQEYYLGTLIVKLELAVILIFCLANVGLFKKQVTVNLEFPDSEIYVVPSWVVL